MTTTTTTTTSRRSLRCGLAALLLVTACDSSLEEEDRPYGVRVESSQVSKEVQAKLDAPARGKQARTARTTVPEAEFERMRADYRRRVEASLAGLELRIAQLEDRSKGVADRAKADSFALLNTIRTKRLELRRDLDDLDRTKMEHWEAARAPVDKRWTELKELALVEP